MSVVTPQTIPNAAQPVQGVPGSRSTFFLRSTPKPFSVLLSGSSNQDFVIASVVPFERAQVRLGSRVYQRRLPGGTEKASSATQSFTLSIATAGTRTSLGNTAALPLTLTIATTTGASTGSASMALVFSISSKAAGALSLTPEAGDGLTLTAESGDALTLTSEASDSLDLTPET